MKTLSTVMFYSLMFAFVSIFIGCGEHKPTLSLLPDRNVFQQTSSSVNNKLDIVWIIDNSGSMQEEQDNLNANFSYFINSFINKGYDFKIAVITTEAWKALFGSPNYAKFRDGVPGNQSGVFVITPQTPNILSTFIINANQGTGGDGDERSFQSLKTALESSLNPGFLRTGAYLAVINLSDEDDFSHDGSFYINENYNYSGIHTVQSYVTYLDGKTQSSGASRRYSFSTISIQDAACLAQNPAGGNISYRYNQLADATGGIKADICAASYATALDQIQTRIAELSTQFFLNREPIPSSIRVFINNNPVPESATDGWTYHADTISIMFHGTWIPPQGASIAIDFDPVTIK